MKWINFFIFSLLAAKSLADSVPANIDFDHEMGKGSSAWEHLITPEDHDNLATYKALFEKNKAVFASNSTVEKIPSIIHLIWLCPSDLSELAIQNMQRWKDLHPSWKIYLWTDRTRVVPVEGVELKICRNFPFLELSHEYYDAENYGEKSHVLRYAILSHLGGIYVDHDVYGLKSLDPLRKFDFFLALEPLSDTYLSTSVYPSSSIIGSAPSHPILRSSSDWLHSYWHELGQMYPGNNEESVVNRVKHRALSCLEYGIKKDMNTNNLVNIVLPSSFFNKNITKEVGFAHHFHIGSWHKKVHPLEKKVERYSKDIQKKNNTIKLLFIFLLVSQMFICSFLILLWKRLKRKEGTLI
ncbi:MAG: hypothetical protein EBZ47_03185 [Chlamydiae bacterium]|nr:hypothetical protein [Chlamydiota bacterium]